MKLNIFNIIALIFRLAPFLIVSTFTISSLINQDYKGFAFLAGVLIACFSSIVLGFMVPSSSGPGQKCSLISLAGKEQEENGYKTVVPDGNFTNIPLGITIISYTFIYFVAVIGKYNIWINNLGPILLFGILLVYEFVWVIMNNCFSIPALIFAVLIGGGIGAWWAFYIMEYGTSNMQYYAQNVDDATDCRMVANNVFKCTFNPSQRGSVSSEYMTKDQIIELHNKDILGFNKIDIGSSGGRSGGSSGGNITYKFNDLLNGKIPPPDGYNSGYKFTFYPVKETTRLKKAANRNFKIYETNGDELILFNEEEFKKSPISDGESVSNIKPQFYSFKEHTYYNGIGTFYLNFETRQIQYIPNGECSVYDETKTRVLYFITDKSISDIDNFISWFNNKYKIQNKYTKGNNAT